MSTTLKVERVGPALCAVGESPLWAPQERALYWVDIEGRAIQRWQPGSGLASQWALPERPGSIALHGAGGLVCALESSVVHLRLPEQGPVRVLEVLAPVVHPAPGMRLNDGRCDRQGRFWVGSMVMNMGLASAQGQLYSLAGSAWRLRTAGPLVVPNGLAFSPDGRTLYLSDSHPSSRLVWAFELNDDGGLSGQRVFVNMNLHPGRPDGATVDVDGCYWTCANDAGLVHRFTPDGRLDRSIAVPVSKPSMCAFGGAQMDELYITSIRPAALSAAPAAPAELAGATFVCLPGVQGVPETAFHALAPRPPSKPSPNPLDSTQ